MRTPIADFVKNYREKGMSRFHMPGHKGCSFFGPEPFDITEIKGADSLYEADGIIAESEENATMLFGSGRTFYSTEGSSQCIRAMLYLALQSRSQKGRPYVVAARNVHKSFLYAAALLDFDVVWLWPKEMHSLLSCRVNPENLEQMLADRKNPPAAVYVTSPDYLGGQQDIRILSEICHRYDTILLVDNAHGAYHHFTEEKLHPMDLGADMCCDSAHKTLPVLTGGAYLHMNREVAGKYGQKAKQALALFGSTSPSYLILASLDRCNQYLDGPFREELTVVRKKIDETKKILKERGWQIEKTEPLKITVRCPKGRDGYQMAEQLRSCGVECEYADRDYVVLMASPQNTEEDFERLLNGFGWNKETEERTGAFAPVMSEQKMSIRNALFCEQETVKAEESLGRICGAPTVSCPPAIPIVVSGEEIDENAINMFLYYGITEVDVVKEDIR